MTAAAVEDMNRGTVQKVKNKDETDNRNFQPSNNHLLAKSLKTPFSWEDEAWSYKAFYNQLIVKGKGLQYQQDTGLGNLETIILIHVGVNAPLYLIDLSCIWLS